jgi:hypothetical protein
MSRFVSNLDTLTMIFNHSNRSSAKLAQIFESQVRGIETWGGAKRTISDKTVTTYLSILFVIEMEFFEFVNLRQVIY